MFDDEIYEVTRDEFKGFMNQIKPECFEHETQRTPTVQEVRVTSKDGTRLFAKVISTTDEAHYYVYEMPRDDERQAAKAIRQIQLDTKEEVQAFFEVLNKIQKGEYEHD